jgi:hypothetical protein
MPSLFRILSFSASTRSAASASRRAPRAYRPAPRRPELDVCLQSFPRRPGDVGVSTTRPRSAANNKPKSEISAGTVGADRGAAMARKTLTDAIPRVITRSSRRACAGSISALARHLRRLLTHFIRKIIIILDETSFWPNEANGGISQEIKALPGGEPQRILFEQLARYQTVADWMIGWIWGSTDPPPAIGFIRRRNKARLPPTIRRWGSTGALRRRACRRAMPPVGRWRRSTISRFTKAEPCASS